MKALSRTSLIVSLVALAGGMAAQNAGAMDDVIRWQSINGIIQGGNIVGTGAEQSPAHPGHGRRSTVT
jgi:hypothetical protein